LSKVSAVAADVTALSHERGVVRLAAMILTMAALIYYAGHGYLLLYGDAVAHLHIARRVFDSLNPGFRQLGSVWLPLPHLLLLPFVQKMAWWQNGMAGAVPSMVSYVAGCIGIYRLARNWMDAQFAAIAALFYGVNPGLLYFSTTAMTEPLFLAEMIWAAVLLVEFARSVRDAAATRPAKLLVYLGAVLVAAVFTRYDGWIYAAVAWLVATILLLNHWDLKNKRTGAWLLFTAMVIAAPLLWMAYNAKQFHDPLDFLRGPYSAKAIELRTATPGAPHYPGFHSMRVAALYFLKAAELGAAWPACANLLLLIAAVGTALACWISRHARITLLLWLPLPFYAYSIAYGSVPIFIPVWWPFSWYNTRYGMELLPAFALFIAFAVAAAVAVVSRIQPGYAKWAPLVASLLIVANSAALLHAKPLVLQEALANARTRIPFEHALAIKLDDIPTGERILMYTSAHVGALQQAGIPLKDTVNEGDWLLWQAAMKDPAAAAPWVIAIDGDAVADAIKQHPEDLDLLSVTCGLEQGCARIYRSKLPAAGRSS
jgi:4-amino-4-deoxy-L-arabinose transferase-like glycosyltransferase